MKVKEGHYYKIRYISHSKTCYLILKVIVMGEIMGYKEVLAHIMLDTDHSSQVNWTNITRSMEDFWFYNDSTGDIEELEEHEVTLELLG